MKPLDKNYVPVPTWAAGLAFFSMFFGSGNLLFPLHIGRTAGDLWPQALMGFFLGAVALPITAVLCMVYFKGDTFAFMATSNKKFAWTFMSICVFLWIPIGAGPRCIIVAYESFKTIFPALATISSPPYQLLSLLLFNVVYSSFVCYNILHRDRILRVLGVYLTPMLMVVLAVLFYFVFRTPAAYLDGRLTINPRLFLLGRWV